MSSTGRKKKRAREEEEGDPSAPDTPHVRRVKRRIDYFGGLDVQPSTVLTLDRLNEFLQDSQTTHNEFVADPVAAGQRYMAKHRAEDKALVEAADAAIAAASLPLRRRVGNRVTNAVKTAIAESPSVFRIEEAKRARLRNEVKEAQDFERKRVEFLETEERYKLELAERAFSRASAVRAGVGAQLVTTTLQGLSGRAPPLDVALEIYRMESASKNFNKEVKKKNNKQDIQMLKNSIMVAAGQGSVGTAAELWHSLFKYLRRFGVTTITASATSGAMLALGIHNTDLFKKTISKIGAHVDKSLPGDKVGEYEVSVLRKAIYEWIDKENKFGPNAWGENPKRAADVPRIANILSTAATLDASTEDITVSDWLSRKRREPLFMRKVPGNVRGSIFLNLESAEHIEEAFAFLSKTHPHFSADRALVTDPGWEQPLHEARALMLAAAAANSKPDPKISA